MLSPSRGRNENMMKSDMNRCLHEFARLWEKIEMFQCVWSAKFFDMLDTRRPYLDIPFTLFAIEHSCKLMLQKYFYTYFTFRILRVHITKEKNTAM